MSEHRPLTPNVFSEPSKKGQKSLKVVQYVFVLSKLNNQHDQQMPTNH